MHRTLISLLGAVIIADIASVTELHSGMTKEQDLNRGSNLPDIPYDRFRSFQKLAGRQRNFFVYIVPRGPT